MMTLSVNLNAFTQKKLLLPFLIKEKIVRVQPKTYYDEPLIYRSS